MIPSVRRSSRSFLIGLVLGALATSCGGRTNLKGAPPCHVAGAILECTGVCGIGTTICEDGYWSECQIAPSQEACSDNCGEGIRYCSDERWTLCQVPTQVESCENDCGTGTRSCSQRLWSECLVAPVERECSFGCGTGTESCEDGSWGLCDAPPPLPPVLQATVRDFSSSHPDFERPNSGSSSLEKGIVEERLDTEGKPVYAGGFPYEYGKSTTGKDEFDQWYRDVPGVNEKATLELRLVESTTEEDFYVYEDHAFFPIDGILMDKGEYSHNYHFTLEIAASFVYREGQVFRFNGDDDIWVFINGHLVIDLGGTHVALGAEVVLENIADEVQILPGEEYLLHIFFAERHTIDSNFVIETSIAGLGECASEL